MKVKNLIKPYARKLTLYFTLITHDIQVVKVKCSNFDGIGVSMLLQREIGLFRFIQSKTISHLDSANKVLLK